MAKTREKSFHRWVRITQHRPPICYDVHQSNNTTNFLTMGLICRSSESQLLEFFIPINTEQTSSTLVGWKKIVFEFPGKERAVFGRVCVCVSLFRKYSLKAFTMSVSDSKRPSSPIFSIGSVRCVRSITSLRFLHSFSEFPSHDKKDCRIIVISGFPYFLV